ncbi:hypothetical protein Pst134EA_007012 [Puccinia striiformis f. sp. tritici]|uniref:hypothetical protein n=1 Tax=Puccinia striiformis f. sp. tritici TaxID=168172 RepID=UPI0020075065|nr:hypothetical protein Pst134EA_007012 [Puccinia striiformis f. sp. tritici]KAH9469733.1 hypothetical protein Pst134EA_007012 [Puccinia striiformis f. sp. tritici]
MFIHSQIQQFLLAVAYLSLLTWTKSTNTPQSGALIVRQANPGNGEYATIAGAVSALKGLTGPQTIFVYPGTYSEQLRINYPDSLSLQGYSANPASAERNEVTVRVAIGAAQAGSNAKSAAIWAQSTGIHISNFNVINSFGTGTDTQALALASTGQKQVFKYCTFSSFQDTVQVSGVSYFYGCRIEGAVDFIFGPGSAWFESVVVAIKASPTPVITAQKNSPGGHTSIVINKSQVISAGAKPDSAYLGRPWSEDATVVFQSCSLGDVIKPEGWRAWNPPSDPRTAHATFQEYKNFGAGANTSARQIGTQRSSPVDIADVLGSDHGTWAK